MNIDYFFGTEDGRRIYERDGYAATLAHLAEECAELIVEMIHARRKDRVRHDEKIIEEICDVLILIDDIWTDYGNYITEQYKIRAKGYNSDFEEESDKFLLRSLANLLEISLIYSFDEIKSTYYFTDYVVDTIISISVYIKQKDINAAVKKMLKKKREKRSRHLAGEIFD